MREDILVPTEHLTVNKFLTRLEGFGLDKTFVQKRLFPRDAASPRLSRATDGRTPIQDRREPQARLRLESGGVRGDRDPEVRPRDGGRCTVQDSGSRR